MRKWIAILIIVGIGSFYMPVSAQEDPDVVGWLSIPSIWDYAKPVVDGGWDVSNLGNGIAHLDSSNWIHSPQGRVVIAAHNPGAFSLIGDIAEGDVIGLWDKDGMAVYKVIAIHKGVDPTDISWTFNTVERTLILLACWDNERSRIVIEAVRTG